MKKSMKVRMAALGMIVPVLASCGLAATKGGVAGSQPGPAPTLAPCPPGEVTVWAGEPVGCDLIGGVNTLTELGGTEADCDLAGGKWWYEACLEMDF